MGLYPPYVNQHQDGHSKNISPTLEINYFRSTKKAVHLQEVREEDTAHCEV